MTNFARPGSKKGPLAKLLRQLRVRWEDFALVPQVGSSIAFPDVTLGFQNDFEFFKSEVHRAFPAEIDNFQRLVDGLLDYDDLGGPHAGRSARAVVSETIRDPLLVEMLFCPLMFYGARGRARHGFCPFFDPLSQHLFRRARPALGRNPADSETPGAQIPRTRWRTAAPRGRQPHFDRGRRGSLGTARRWPGVGRARRFIVGRLGRNDAACATAPPAPTPARPDSSRSSKPFRPSIARRASWAARQTVVFFNDSEKFHWQKPDDLVDVRSGVTCSPNNFLYDEPEQEGQIRITALANFDLWKNLNEEEYRQAKLTWYDRLNASAVRFLPDYRRAVIDSDSFTPCTIRRFTGPRKWRHLWCPRKAMDRHHSS